MDKMFELIHVNTSVADLKGALDLIPAMELLSLKTLLFI